MRLRHRPPLRWSGLSRARTAVVGLVALATLATPVSVDATTSPGPATHAQRPVRWIDSETGYAIPPDRIGTGTTEGLTRAQSSGIDTAGPAATTVPSAARGQVVSAPGYRAFVADLDTPPSAEAARIDVLLDPLTPPPELAPDRIVALHRSDATLLLGFVVDDDSGEPLPTARVSSAPSGVETATDTRGFFQLHVPIPSQAEARDQPASLTIEKPGYTTQTRSHLELWPNGDWTYRIRLERGNGLRVTDENGFRRRAPPSDSSAPAAMSAPPAASPTSDANDQDAWRAAHSKPGASATPSANATVRLPRHIRVQNANGVVEYVSLEFYCRRVLPAEWIPAWANYPGGSHSLNAGAVAVRTYAVGAINNPRSSTYDICGTTSCQVYGPNTSTATDAAVGATADWLIIDSDGAIPSGLTEYSAENNQLGSACGDGFGAPTGSCLYDPVCAGESTYGHGRGLCQWGSARWATGRRMAGRRTSDATPTGYPQRDWTWILRHYYPALTLIQAAPLAVGDPVRALRNVNVRACAGGSIAAGVDCPVLATKAAGATGTVVDGPLRVLSDGAGWTWYRVQWPDVTGWSVENYLERVVRPPAPPVGLAAVGVAADRINLTWATTGAAPVGWRIERAPGRDGPWIEIAVAGPDTTAYTDAGRAPGSTWFYRVRAYNAAGESPNVEPVSAVTPGLPPVLDPLPDRRVTVGMPLSFVAHASAPDSVHALADFEPFMSETANGTALFRDPRQSSTTRGFLDAAPNLAVVTDTFPTAGHGTGRVLRISWRFTASAMNPWLRLTAAGAAWLPNPIIDFTRRLRFGLYADRPVSIALGCRETATPRGATLGADGGTAGPIEWVGVTGEAGGAPIPSRIVPGRQWTSLEFDLPHEPAHSFSGGNEVLFTPSGLGVLEHLAIVPLDGPGVYNLYLDDLVVLVPKTLEFALEGNTPAGAAIDPATGVFSWTPVETQPPGVYPFTVRVTDSQIPRLGTTQSFIATVYRRPALAFDFAPNGNPTIAWTAVPGAAYRVQYKDDLNHPTWLDLGTPVTAVGPSAEATDPARERQRFYRVLVTGDGQGRGTEPTDEPSPPSPEP